ncbi:MAG: Gfo/Idh/MocA family oxidoreductase [Clostridiales bacterium]|nr:Gfo/Idh/MocA family oxidoreductase [Clostridiales bacterium]
MEKIKIGQIGIGHNHGAEKMRAVRKFPELFEVVGWCEEDERWVKERGGMDVYRDLPRLSREELLEYSGIEAMLIETDVWNMMPAAAECVKRGIHIHLDKPAGEDYNEYEAIIREAEKNNAVVQLGYMYRYNPAVQYILERVRSGELGRVLMVDTDMCTEHDVEFRRWLEHFKGGDMYIFGSHLIDLVLLLQGEPTAVHSYLKKTELDGTSSYDSTLALLEYPDSVSTVRVTSIEANGYGRRQLVVVCERGSFEVKPFENPTRLYFTPKGKYNAYEYHSEEIELPKLSGRYDEMICDLYSFIREGKENPYGYDHELKLHKLILKACGIL